MPANGVSLKDVKFACGAKVVDVKLGTKLYMVDEHMRFYEVYFHSFEQTSDRRFDGKYTMSLERTHGHPFQIENTYVSRPKALKQLKRNFDVFYKSLTTRVAATAQG
jgi:hypothetical protein